MPGSRDGRLHGGSHGQDSHRSRHSHRSREHRRTRSRSPERRHDRRSEDRGDARKPKTHGEDSSRRHRSPHRHRHRSHKSDKPQEAVPLPFEARQLVKGDLDRFEPLLAHYLFVQKQKDAYDMDEREIKGRWKSFVSKWNRNELAEGWYDPEMFARIVAMQPEEPRERISNQASQGVEAQDSESDDGHRRGGGGGSGSDDEDYGPTLPGQIPGRRMGVGIPSKDDLAERDALRQEDRDAARDELRAERKADRKLQKDRLEELVPRAEAGTRERKLEKRRDVNDKMREFRDKSPGGEVNEGELMGGGDSLAEYKQMKQQEQRRKTEREIQREEFERAKREEVEEKRRQWQEREQGTISMLQELARQRFG